jgi:phospholipid/cholesterol/gamma-HCH transport system substrate-binding protein
VRRAIREHRRDVGALLAIFALAVVIGDYILTHQPAFTFGKSYYTVNAQFSNAAAITSGQGQAVTIAGVQVGQVGGVAVQDGHAVVTMNIYTQYAPIYRDATVLLRPRTPLKDMYLALDPGTRSAGRIPANGTLPIANTQPDIDVDQILASLDADTRSYLLLLLSGGAQAFQDQFSPGATTPSADAVAGLRGTFKRFSPLARDTRTFSTLLATRQRDIAHSVHNLQLVATALGGVDNQFASLIRASNTNFAAIAAQQAGLRGALSRLPPTLQTTSTTLGVVRGFATQSGAALRQLEPFAREFAPALDAARPLLRDTTPVLRDQLRPFTRAITPLARTLSAGASKLAAATPNLSGSVTVLNSLLNTLAFAPGGGKHGYLFWGSWLAHIADSLTGLQDAHGPIVRGLLMATCPELNLLEVTIEQGSPSLGPILKLLNPPDWSTIKSSFCPAGGL